MNKRIRQLAVETDAWCDQNHAGDDQYDLRWEEKFAELIVEECCHRLGEETIRHDGYGYNQHELYNRLRKHFGIEE
jgi:hypothetical protein